MFLLTVGEGLGGRELGTRELKERWGEALREAREEKAENESDGNREK